MSPYIPLNPPPPPDQTPGVGKELNEYEALNKFGWEGRGVPLRVLGGGPTDIWGRGDMSGIFRIILRGGGGGIGGGGEVNRKSSLT